MFKPEMNPLAPKPSGPRKPEKDLVRIWLGDAAASEMDEREPETGDGDLKAPVAQALTEKEKRILWEMKRPDEVTLRNIPKWKELPDEETFKRDFKFDWILEDEYRKGRPIEEFETQVEIETLPRAKVFEITEAMIDEAQRKNSLHRGSFSKDEILQAIDEAGYRPATLEELLAYARDYWKPDSDPETLTKEERDILHSQAPYIFGLNSIFSGSDGRLRAPSLGWRGAGRDLRAHVLDYWGAGRYFLVLRKASPS